MSLPDVLAVGLRTPGQVRVHPGACKLLAIAGNQIFFFIHGRTPSVGHVQSTLQCVNHTEFYKW